MFNLKKRKNARSLFRCFLGFLGFLGQSDELLCFLFSLLHDAHDFFSAICATYATGVMLHMNRFAFGAS